MSRKKTREQDKENFQHTELLEFVDVQKRPLGVLPREDIHNQNLMHKSVQVLLFNREKKLYIQQRSHNKDVYPGYWDVSAAGHVLSGESGIEAAMRELKEELGIQVNNMRFVYEFSATYYTGYEFLSLYVTGPCAEIPDPDPEEVVQGIFVSKQEMNYLINFYSRILTPGLLHYWRTGCLFPE